LACVVIKVTPVYDVSGFPANDDEQRLLYYNYAVVRIEDVRWRYRNGDLDGEYVKEFTADELHTYIPNAMYTE
jgi:hypothetical protein